MADSLHDAALLESDKARRTALVADARDYGKRAIEAHRALVERPDATPIDFYQYAKALRYCKLDDLRDPEIALWAAKQAVEMADAGPNP